MYVRIYSICSLNTDLAYACGWGPEDRRRGTRSSQSGEYIDNLITTQLSVLNTQCMRNQIPVDPVQSGLDDEDCSLRDPPVPRLVVGDVVHGDRVVPVGLHFLRDVNDDGGPREVVHRDVPDPPGALYEVGGRVGVGAGVIRLGDLVQLEPGARAEGATDFDLIIFAYVALITKCHKQLSRT